MLREELSLIRAMGGQQFVIEGYLTITKLDNGGNIQDAGEGKGNHAINKLS